MSISAVMSPKLCYMMGRGEGGIFFWKDDCIAVHLGAIYSGGGEAPSSGIYVGMCETVSYCWSEGRPVFHHLTFRSAHSALLISF